MIRTAAVRVLGSTTIVLVVVTVAVIGALTQRSAPPATTTVSEDLRDDGRTTTEADGALPDVVNVFDDHYPGVANLDPDLLEALRTAATDAAHDGIEFNVNSGWRSPAHQEQLLREAVAKYGSAAEAARWVATADTSPHVAGSAVDIGRPAAAAWLAEHGARYGLCRIFRNEPWHFELRPEAVEHGCPPMYDDPSQDPRPMTSFSLWVNVASDR